MKERLLSMMIVITMALIMLPQTVSASITNVYGTPAGWAQVWNNMEPNETITISLETKLAHQGDKCLKFESWGSKIPDHYVMMGKMIAGEAVKTIAKAEKLACDCLVSKLEFVNYKRMEISEDRIANARHIIATVKEIPGVKIAADGTDPDQYALAMSKKLIDFIENSPESYDVPLQFIKIGDVKIYVFHSEIFCTYGKMIKTNAGTEKCFVTTLGNGSYGYIPTKDLIYDTIYESRPGTFKFTSDAGEKMTEKLLEMGK